MSHKNRNPIQTAFIFYLILFYAAWVGWVYFVYPHLRALGESRLLYAVFNTAIRLVLWVLPVFCYLKYIDGVRPTAYLKLRQHVLRGVLIAVVFTAVNLMLSLAQIGIPHPNLHSLTWNNIINTSFMIGFVEEVPFRGFIFQKLNERYTLVTATVLSALLFLAIHLPGWISLHLLTPHDVVFVFAFGILMVIVFRLSKSLWGPILSHSLNDLLAAVIFHR